MNAIETQPQPIAQKPSGGMRYVDYCALPAELRCELISGELAMTPSPSTKHQRIAGELFYQIKRYLDDHPAGVLFFAPMDVVLSPHDVVQPDLLLVLNENRGLIEENAIAGAPDLVAEVLSAGTLERDVIHKTGLYERYGVKEFWRVDPQLERIERLNRPGGKLEVTATFTKNERLESLLLPELTIGLDAVFASVS